MSSASSSATPSLSSASSESPPGPRLPFVAQFFTRAAKPDPLPLITSPPKTSSSTSSTSTAMWANRSVSSPSQVSPTKPPPPVTFSVENLTVEEGSVLILAVIRAAVALSEQSDAFVRKSSESSDTENDLVISESETNLVEALKVLVRSDSAESDQRCQIVAGQKGFHHLTLLLQRYARKAIVLRHIMAALCRLASIEGLADKAIESGLIQEVLKVVQSQFLQGKFVHSQDDILGDAILLLGNLAYDPTARSLIFDCNGIKTLIQIMTARKDRVEILDHCCYTLANLCVGSAENMDQIVDLNGVQLVIESLNRFNQHVELMESGTCVLTNLCALGNTVRGKIAESGGVKMLAYILVEHLENVSVVSSVLRTLANVALCPTNTSYLIRDNAIISICDTMSGHKSNPEVVELTCQILNNVTSQCSTNEMGAILKEGVLNVLVSSCKPHNNPKLKLLFLQCLANMASRFVPIMESKTTRNFVIPAIIDTVSEMRDKPKIVKVGLVILSKLSMAEANVEHIMSLNGGQVALELMKEYQESKNTATFSIILSFLCSISNKESADKLLELNLIENLSTILTLNIRDLQILDLCLRTFARVSFSASASLEISKTGLKTIVSAVQLNVWTNDKDFLLITSTLFFNLASNRLCLLFMRNLVPKVVVSILRVERDPPLTSQCAWQLISVLVKLLNGDDSGTVIQRCKECEAAKAVQNLKAQYQKTFHAQLEKSISDFFGLMSDHGKSSDDIESPSKPYLLQQNAETAKSIRAAAKIRKDTSGSERGGERSSFALNLQGTDSPRVAINVTLTPSVEESEEIVPSPTLKHRRGSSNLLKELELKHKESSSEAKSTISPRSPDSKKGLHKRRITAPSYYERAPTITTRESNLDDGSLALHGNNLMDLKKRNMQFIESELSSTKFILRESDRDNGILSPILDELNANVADHLSDTLNSVDIEQWKEFLKDPSSKLQDIESTRNLVKSGIPQEFRSRIWKIMSGAEDLKSNHSKLYYSQLVEIVEKWGTPHDAEIRKDVPRTLPHIDTFKTEEGRKSLMRVLSAYCLRNPETVGYCQSMNNVCGALLKQMENEEDSFWMLCSMIENRMGYYCKSMCALVVDQRVLEDLVSFELPLMYDHLKKHDVQLSSMAVSWFLCSFVEAPLQLDACFMFWDYLFIFGDEMLFQMALKLLSHVQPDLLKLNSQSDILSFILHGIRKNPPDIDVLLKSIGIGTLLDKISTLREYHRQKITWDPKSVRPPMTYSGGEFKWQFTEEEISDLWQDFLKPSPWHIMLYSCLNSPTFLHHAILPAVFETESTSWRDQGLLSGLFSRLFQVLDTNGSGQIDFNEFLTGAHIFLKAPLEERLALVFRFCDFNDDGMIDQNELRRLVLMLEESYNGRCAASENSADAFVNLVFDTQKKSPSSKDVDADKEDMELQSDMLTFNKFIPYALMSSLICRFFKLDPSAETERLSS